LFLIEFLPIGLCPYPQGKDKNQYVCSEKTNFIKNFVFNLDNGYVRNLVR